jgi:hypothetical protein
MVNGGLRVGPVITKAPPRWPLRKTAILDVSPFPRIFNDLGPSRPITIAAPSSSRCFNSTHETQIIITPQMLRLFERGLQLVAEGHDDVDDKGPEHNEFRAIDEELCWRMMKLQPHMVSPLDPVLDGPMPEYIARLASGRDRDLSKQWRKALQAALDARRR